VIVDVCPQQEERMVRPEVIEIEADTLPEAFRLVADECCIRHRYLDAPLDLRIEFYGARMYVTCEDLSTGKPKERLVYTFLVTYEGGK
jgi:hypothetical protein